MVDFILELSCCPKNELVAILEVLPLRLSHLRYQVKEFSTCHSVLIEFTRIKFHVLGKMPGENILVLLALDDGGRGG